MHDDATIRPMAAGREATVEDLAKIRGKAEIVGGEIVLMSPAGGLHGYAAGEIYASLREYARRTHSGYALPDNVGFIVNLRNRRSFSPDVAFVNGDTPLTEKFIDGAPVFAVEVRSVEDYGPAADRAMAAKRADYFAAGTLVVWDVDTLESQTVSVYRAANPLSPTVYRRGEHADAEPALPGWTMPVDDVFPPSHSAR
jgi:Uma2 family endonuclease